MHDKKEKILTVKNAHKNFGGVVANKNISLEVIEGNITGLIGPNGSGKTTLFNSIVGYHPVDSGQIYFDNQEISAMTIDSIARLGLLRTFQQTRVYKKLNCVDNLIISISNKDTRFIDIFKPFKNKENIEKAHDLLEFVGLYSKRLLFAGELSFGQQKLLELVMALINEPRILLLDEPTAGINPTLINGLIERLKKINENYKITLFIIEHNMRVIMNVANDIYCMANGEIIAHDTPKAIQESQIVRDAYLGQ